MNLVVEKLFHLTVAVAYIRVLMDTAVVLGIAGYHRCIMRSLQVKVKLSLSFN